MGCCLFCVCVLSGVVVCVYVDELCGVGVWFGVLVLVCVWCGLSWVGSVMVWFGLVGSGWVVVLLCLLVALCCCCV